jgi:hypothetical protein
VDGLVIIDEEVGKLMLDSENWRFKISVIVKEIFQEIVEAEFVVKYYLIELLVILPILVVVVSR